MTSRSRAALLMILFLSAVMAFAQTQEQRPTLGKSPSESKPGSGAPPSLKGIRNFNTMDARALLRTHKIYIESMDNSLNLQLADALSKQGPFAVVDDRKQADAILRGTCFDSPRLKDVHSEVFLTAPGGKAIWQDVIRQPYSPPSLKTAVNLTAQQVAMHMRQSIEEAHHQ